DLLPAIIVVPMTKGLEPATEARLREALEAAIRRERYSSLVTSATGAAPSCGDAMACEVEKARKLEVEMVLHLRASREGSGIKLGLEVMDVAVGDIATTQEKTCAGCSDDKAASELAAMFGPLARKANDRPRAQLKLRS